MSYKALRKTVILENLEEGQVVDIDIYIDKLKFFQRFGSGNGTYITERCYIEHTETGLHYYNYDTLIKYFSSLPVPIQPGKGRLAKIEFSASHKLDCKPHFE